MDRIVIPNLASQVLSARPLRVFGDGTREPIFSHADDVVRALALTLRAGGEDVLRREERLERRALRPLSAAQLLALPASST
jgi:nucleoside-diphosphate-sugar epimerase